MSDDKPYVLPGMAGYYLMRIGTEPPEVLYWDGTQWWRSELRDDGGTTEDYARRHGIVMWGGYLGKSGTTPRATFEIYADGRTYAGDIEWGGLTITDCRLRGDDDDDTRVVFEHPVKIDVRPAAGTGVR